MNRPPDEPGRKRPVHLLLTEQGNRSSIVFLTVCAKDRRPLLAAAGMHALLLKWWAKADHWRVGRYVVLPDHVHLFCAPAEWPPTSLARWVGFWKNGVARDAGVAGLDGTLWQREFWDTQLRRGESCAAKWEYVRGNAVRHGLVKTAEEWGFQGEIERLEWHDR